MKTLEELLKQLGCGMVFNKEGQFTKKGSETYNRLQKILMDIAVLTGISTEEICLSIDEISNENH